MEEKKKYFKFPKTLDRPKTSGQYFPIQIHQLLHENPTKKMLTRMALEPDFKQALQELAEE